METKIVLSLLRTIGIHNPTSEDFQRVCGIVRVDKLPKKVKLALWLGLPVITQYITYILNPEEPVEEHG